MCPQRQGSHLVRGEQGLLGCVLRILTLLHGIAYLLNKTSNAFQKYILVMWV